MPILTDLASAQVKSNVTKLYGQTLTTPALLVSDGISLTYAVDVNVGPTDPTGRISQYYAQHNDGSLVVKHGQPQSGGLSGLPGQGGTQPDDDLTINTVLHNVVISRNNADLIYADVGTPVELTRSVNGQWQVTGLAMEMPGTYTLVPVNLQSFPIGSITGPQGLNVAVDDAIDLTLLARPLTFQELGTIQPFGQIPWGASGIWVGGVLQRIV